MNLGAKLHPHACIGIINVSSACGHDDLQQGVQYLEALGYRTKIASNCYENYYNFSGDDHTKIQALENFFLDSEVDIIIAARGGYGAIHLLDKINYEIIRDNPKIFVGFSDLTSLQIAFYKYADLVTFQGPMLTSHFSRHDLEMETKESLFSLIKGIETETITKEFEVLISGSAEGVLLGGNLITFMSLMGTPYEIDFMDKILYFEDVSEATYSLDRALTQLLISGKLIGVKGFVFGTFKDCNRRHDTERELYDMIYERLSCLNVPIIIKVPSGHDNPMITIPLGVKVRLDTQEHTLSLLEAVVR